MPMLPRVFQRTDHRAVETSDKEAAAAAYNTFSSAVDKAAKVGTIPANRAANYKSKAAKAIAKIA